VKDGNEGVPGSDSKPIPPKGAKTSPKGHGSKFERKMHAAVMALLTHRTHDEAARAAGISPAALYRWRKLAEFQELYERTRKEMFEHATHRAQFASEAALSTQLKIMVTSPSDACRLRAAEKVWAIADKASQPPPAQAALARRRSDLDEQVPENLAERLVAARKRLQAARAEDEAKKKALAENSAKSGPARC